MGRELRITRSKIPVFWRISGFHKCLELIRCNTEIGVVVWSRQIFSLILGNITIPDSPEIISRTLLLLISPHLILRNVELNI